MAFLLIGMMLLFALACIFPGPSKTSVIAEGCRCNYCSWYVTPSEHCSDLLRRPHYLRPRWSFSSPQELVDAWRGEIDDALTARSIAYLGDLAFRNVVESLTGVQPLSLESGPIYFHRLTQGAL